MCMLEHLSTLQTRVDELQETQNAVAALLTRSNAALQSARVELDTLHHLVAGKMASTGDSIPAAPIPAPVSIPVKAHTPAPLPEAVYIRPVAPVVAAPAATPVKVKTTASGEIDPRVKALSRDEILGMASKYGVNVDDLLPAGRKPSTLGKAQACERIYAAKQALLASGGEAPSAPPEAVDAPAESVETLDENPFEVASAESDPPAAVQASSDPEDCDELDLDLFNNTPTPAPAVLPRHGVPARP